MKMISIESAGAIMLSAVPTTTLSACRVTVPRDSSNEYIMAPRPAGIRANSGAIGPIAAIGPVTNNAQINPPTII